MPDLRTFASDPAVDLLGWTLLHVVWQGALLAAAVAGALHLLRHHTPRVRYAVSCAALLGLLALPVGTGVFLSGQGLSETDGAFAPEAESVVRSALSQPSVTASAATASPSWGARAERERPDRLREQARRLREQAERLERRAEAMETPPPPSAPADATNNG